MPGRRVSVWDEKVTIHPTISERENTALRELAKDLHIRKSVMTHLVIREHPMVKEKIKELEQSGHFN